MKKNKIIVTDIANIFAAIVLGVAIGLLIVLLRVYEFI